jgi:hypothetical protein
MKTATILIPLPVGTADFENKERSLRRVIPRLNAEFNGKFDKKLKISIALELLKSKPGGKERNEELLRIVEAYEDLLCLVHPNTSWVSASGKVEITGFLNRLQKKVVVFSGIVGNDNSYLGSYSITKTKKDLSACVIREQILHSNTKDVCHLHEEGERDDFNLIFAEACNKANIQFQSISVPKGKNNTERRTPEYRNLVREKLAKLSNPGTIIQSIFSGNYYGLEYLSEHHPGAQVINTNIGPIPDGINKTDYQYISLNQSQRKEVELEEFFTRHGKVPSKLLWRIDMLFLISSCLEKITKSPDFDTTDLFSLVCRELSNFDGYKDVYKGLDGSYWFNDKRENINTNVFLSKNCKGGVSTLLPFQFEIGESNELMQKIPVVFTFLDMLKVENLDMENGTFRGIFYLDLRCAEKISIDDLELQNIDYSVSDVLIEEMSNSTSQESAHQMYIKRYRVDAHFTFQRLSQKYPFDIQKITVDLSPKNPSARPLHISIVPLEKQDEEFVISGWEITETFQGKKTDFWKVPTSYEWTFKNIMRVGYSFGWKVRRLSTEVVLKALIPISILLIISYVPVFSARENLLEMGGLLITTLLSAIALYFGIDKPKTPKLTILDKIFLGSYIMIGGLTISTLFMLPFGDLAYTWNMNIWKGLYPLTGIVCFFLIRRGLKD